MSTTALMPPPSAYGPRRDEIFDITLGKSGQPLGVLHRGGAENLNTAMSGNSVH